MTRIVRWDPFRDMLAMRGQMDRIMDEWLKESNGAENGENGHSINTMRLALDVSENDNAFVVKASVPGVHPEDLEINFNENTLTIQGETKEDRTEESERYHLRERRFGRFVRSMTVPVAVDADAIDAQYDNGVLTLTLPKAEETKPRKINVRTAQQLVEA
ncbi:MAG: Hsp20/alpha crystallin family protein [Caldilineaceae bacterium]